MKRLFIVCVFLAFAAGLDAQDLYVGQYNIRNVNKKDDANGNGWERRCPVICDILRVESFDIWGAQEVLHSQLEDLQKGLPQYASIGVGRDDGKTKGEYAPIFYKKDRIKCLANGTFWLSETPEVVGSKGWDAKYPRICTWGQFKDKKSGKKFWMFNLHMDHRGVEARKQSCLLILARIKEMCGGQPCILTGDFNVGQDNEIYKILADSEVLSDSYETAEVRFAETGPMNYFKPDYKTERRIDHVFLSQHFRPVDYALLTYSYWVPVEPDEQAKAEIAAGKEGAIVHEQRLPSDHYPIGVHVTTKKNHK